MTSRGGRNSRSQVSSQDNTDLAQPDDPYYDRMFTRLTRTITDSFTQCIDKLIGSREEKMTLKLDCHANDIFQTNQRVDQLVLRTTALEKENADLRRQLVESTNVARQLKLDQESLEQYSRADSSILHGLPLPTQNASEDLFKSVPALLNSHIRDLNLTHEMISAMHRLPGSLPSGPTSSNRPARPPPVVIRLVRKQVRSAIMSGRKSLKGTGLGISDHLTPARAALLKKANALVSDGKATAAWSQDGKVLMKDLRNRTVPITSELDLQQFSA
jgi:hypothetical protein